MWTSLVQDHTRRLLRFLHMELKASKSWRLRSVLLIIHCLLAQGIIQRNRRPFSNVFWNWCSLLISCWHAPAVAEKIKVTLLCGEGQTASNEGPNILKHWFLTHLLVRMQSCSVLPWGKAPGTSWHFPDPVIPHNYISLLIHHYFLSHSLLLWVGLVIFKNSFKKNNLGWRDVECCGTNVHI